MKSWLGGKMASQQNQSLSLLTKYFSQVAGEIESTLDTYDYYKKHKNTFICSQQDDIMVTTSVSFTHS